MATPAVSGALALLLEQRPHMTNKEVKLHLSKACRNLGLPRNQQGWGQVDLPMLLGEEDGKE